MADRRTTAPIDVNIIILPRRLNSLCCRFNFLTDFSIFLALLLLITETTLRGIRHPLVLERFQELKIRAPKPGFSFVLSMTRRAWFWPFVAFFMHGGC